MAIKSIARETVVTTDTDASVAEVVETMEEENVGSVVVVDGDDPVGIVTDRDLVLQVLAIDGDPDSTGVEEVMSRDLVTVEGDVGVLDLMRKMADRSVRRVPVMEDGELSGIITLDDLVVLLSMELQSVANIIRAESPPYEVSATDLFG